MPISSKSNTKKTTRRSAYRRDTKNPPRMYVTSRDVEILEAVEDYRFLSSEQVRALFFSSISQARRRLAKLWHAKLLERTFRPVIPTEGSSPALVALSKQGAMLLAQRTGRDLSEFKHLSARERRSTFFLDHTLCRNDFRIAITLACAQTKGLKLLGWLQKPEDIADSIRVRLRPGAEPERIPLVADGFFVIQAGDKQYAFLVEIDRGTTTSRRIERKLIGYYHWWKQGGPKTCFGVDNIRVLIVTTSERRLENLRKLALKVREDGKGTRLFWFATQDTTRIEKPSEIVRCVWKIGNTKKRENSRLLSH